MVATAVAAPTAPPGLPATRAGARAGRRAVLVWVTFVAVALVWGTVAIAGAGAGLRAAPLYGRWHWHPGWGLAPAAVLAGLVVAWGPGAAARLRWRRVPPLAGMAAAAWTVALAAAGGWSQLTAPLTSRHEYEPFAAGIDGLGTFLRGFTEHLGDYPVHVQGHPPGPVALAWLLDRAGLGGAGWLAALAIAGWGLAVAAALVAARALAGEAPARRAAPALVLLPAAVWAGTSLDGLFAGMAAVGVALAVVAAARRSARRAVVAGVVLGLALLSSYGVALMVAVAAVAVASTVHATRTGCNYTAHDRIATTSLVGGMAAGVLIPLALAAAAGFRWVDGLGATGAAYWSGVAGHRPAAYVTLVGNPAALALATGPAVAVGLAATWVGPDRRARLSLPGVVLAAVVIADLSQMSRGEVERIWLPFVPWLALAAPGDRRAWLATQAGLALLLQAALASSW